MNKEQTQLVLDRMQLVAFQHYRLKDGRDFEFRYVSDPNHGVLFGLVDGRDQYLFVNKLALIVISANSLKINI